MDNSLDNQAAVFIILFIIFFVLILVVASLVIILLDYPNPSQPDDESAYNEEKHMNMLEEKEEEC